MTYFTVPEIEDFISYLSCDWKQFSDGQIVRAMHKTAKIIELSETRVQQIGDTSDPAFIAWAQRYLDFNVLMERLRTEHRNRVMAASGYSLGK